jgi:mannosyltransferase
MTTRWWLILVLILAAGVRLYQLPDRVVWFDEAVSLLVARATPAEIVSAAHDDTHPSGYNLVLHFLPRGEWPARLFSVVCGVLTVAVVFLIGRKSAGPMAGLVSAGLLALCPLHVWYSQEIRMYALQTLLVAMSWWLLLTRRWPGYAVVTALSLYTQYTSVFAIVAQGVYVAWKQRDALQSWLWALAAVAVLFAPGVPLLARQYGGGTFGYWMKDFSWADPLRFFGLLSGAIPKNPGPYWPWAVLSMTAVCLVLYQNLFQEHWRATLRRGRSPAPDATERVPPTSPTNDARGGQVVPPLLWLLVPVGLLSLLSLRVNVFLPRTLVLVTPAFALLLGLAVSSAPNGRWLSLKAIMAALVVAVAGANLVALRNYFWRPNPWIRSDLRAAAARVATEYRPGDLVVHTSRFSYRPFQFYLDPAVPQVVERETEPMPGLFKVIGSRELPVAATGRVWLVVFPDFQRPDAGGVTAAWLKKFPREVIRLDCGGAAP